MLHSSRFLIQRWHDTANKRDNIRATPDAKWRRNYRGGYFARDRRINLVWEPAANRALGVTADYRSEAVSGDCAVIQHSDQHREAIRGALKIRNEVSAEFFDDKVRPMGSIKIEDGKISIGIYHPPSLISSEASGQFLAASIALSLEECWKARPEAFKERFQC